MRLSKLPGWYQEMVETERATYPHKPDCPNCDGGHFVTLLGRVRSHPATYSWQCLGCGSLFVSRMLTGDEKAQGVRVAA